MYTVYQNDNKINFNTALLAGQSPSQIKLRSQMKEEATLHVGVKSQSSSMAAHNEGIKKAEMLAQSMKREKEEAVKLKMVFFDYV